MRSIRARVSRETLADMSYSSDETLSRRSGNLRLFTVSDIKRVIENFIYLLNRSLFILISYDQWAPLTRDIQFIIVTTEMDIIRRLFS